MEDIPFAIEPGSEPRSGLSGPLTGPSENQEEAIERAFGKRALKLEHDSLANLCVELSTLSRQLGAGNNLEARKEHEAVRSLMDELGENRATVSLFERRHSDQLQGDLGTCYLFAAIDALVERNAPLLGRVGRALDLHPRKDQIRLKGEALESFDSKDVKRWIELYHKGESTPPPRAYILMEMAEEVRRKRSGGGKPGPFPSVEAGFPYELWDRTIPDEYIEANSIERDYDARDEEAINSPRRLVCFSFTKAKSPLYGRHSFTLVRMTAQDVHLLDPAKGLVTVSKGEFLKSGPLIEVLNFTPLATPLGEYCELLDSSNSQRLKKSLFEDLVSKEGLYKLLQRSTGEENDLKKDVEFLLAGPYGDLLRELGLSEVYEQAIRGLRPEPRPRPQPEPAPYVPQPISRFEGKERLNLAGLGYLAIPAAAVIFSGALLAVTEYNKNKKGQEQVSSPIDTICNDGRPGEWQLVSGYPVLDTQPKRVNVEVLHGRKQGEDTVMAEAKNLSGTCLNGQAPQFVFGVDPVAADVIKVEGLAGGEVTGSGLYHFSLAAADRKDLKGYLSTTGKLNPPDNEANWAYVESGTSSLSCRSEDSKVSIFCFSDLYLSGLEIQRH